MQQYGYESRGRNGRSWSMTGRPPSPGEAVQWFRLTPWDEVETYTWFKFQPLTPLIMKTSPRPIQLYTDRLHPWANGKEILLVMMQDGTTIGVEPRPKVLVPVLESEVPEELKGETSEGS